MLNSFNSCPHPRKALSLHSLLLRKNSITPFTKASALRMKDSACSLTPDQRNTQQDALFFIDGVLGEPATSRGRE